MLVYLLNQKLTFDKKKKLTKHGAEREEREGWCLVWRFGDFWGIWILDVADATFCKCSWEKKQRLVLKILLKFL